MGKATRGKEARAARVDTKKWPRTHWSSTWTRPARVVRGQRTPHACSPRALVFRIRSRVAKCVKRVVLSLVNTTVQKDWPKVLWLDHTITDKLDAADLGKKQCSHGVTWG